MAELVADQAYGVDAATLLAVLTDPEHLEQKFTAVGFTDVSVTASPGRVVIHRTATVPVPGYATRVLGSTQRVAEVQEWSGAATAPRATFQASAAGTPVQIRGSYAIQPTDEGATLLVRGTVSSSVPFVGGRIATVVADGVLGSLQREHAFTQAWLAAR